jgi:hypothetical protein
VSDAVRLPRRLGVRASARMLLLKSLDIDRILAYSDDRPGNRGLILREQGAVALLDRRELIAAKRRQPYVLVALLAAPKATVFWRSL